MAKLLKIGEVAKLAALSSETIRFYERQKLIAKPRRLANGYRGYSIDAVARLEFIKRAKRLGFSLKEIADLLNLFDDQNTGAYDMKAQAEVKLAQIDAAIEQLNRVRASLLRLTEACPGSGSKERCPIVRALTGDENRLSI